MNKQIIRVVIAEDDQRIAEIQQHFIEQVDCFEVVGLAHSIEQAQKVVEILRPELLLLDIYFPDGNGLNLLKNLRDKDINIDVILTTAARDIETLKSGMHSGIFDYIVKPLVFERIEDSLKRYYLHSQKIKSLNQIDQKDIDALLPRLTPDNTKALRRLPKGIDEITLLKVKELFSADKQSLGASTVGDAIGASRTTARRYLEYLVSTKELIVDVNYGGVGRPERYYCAKP